MRNMKDKKLFIILIICSSILINTSIACAGSVTLSWDQPKTNSDGTPIEDLQGYKIYYGTTSDNLINTISVGNVNTYQVTELTVGETYSFAVTAYDLSGNESEYSPRVSITIMNSPPSDPVLIYPGNKGAYKGNKIGFRWKKSKHPDGSAVTYDLAICQNADMTSGCITETNIASKMKQGIYYAGIGTFSAGFMFFGVVLLLPFRPFNGKGAKRTVRLLPVALAVAGILFLISCGKESDGGFTSLNGNASGDAVMQTEQVLSSGTYYWQVVARDENGGVAYSPVWSFDIQ